MPLGETEASTIALSPGQSNVWESDLALLEYADLVPYLEDSNVALGIEVEMLASPSGNPFPDMIPSASSMPLPLNEDKDPVDATFEGIGSLQLLGTVFEKSANPGQTVWFPFQVVNQVETRILDLSVIGHNSGWVSPEPLRFELGSGQTADVAFRVQVPDNARPGAYAEVFGIVEAQGDSLITGLSKFRIDVVTEEVAKEDAPSVASAAARRTLACLPSCCWV